MGDNSPHVVKGILGWLAGAGTSAGRPGTLPAPCPRPGSGAARARVISGNRAVTQHIWSRLPQNRWEPGGCLCRRVGAVALTWERWRAGLGSGGRRQAPEPRVPGSLRAGVSRETRMLLLMQHNSPGSLPFSHNKHTAKSLASRFDEATCISPFSVYRKLLLKKVILVFTARVKGPGRLASLPAGLRGAEEGPGRPEGAARPGSCESGEGTRAGTSCGAFSP